MATSLNQGSAKIYQFPTGGRAGLGGRRNEEAGGVGTTRVNEALCSDSWYHEAAIQEAKSQPTPKPTNSKPVWES